MTAYPPKGYGRRLHPHGSKGAHLPQDGEPPQDKPEPRHEDRAVQDTLKEHHMARLRHDPEPYLREIHTRIIGDVMVTGSLAGDSTGYSGNRFVRWFSIRHDQVRLKRGWIKLHNIIDVSTRTV